MIRPLIQMRQHDAANDPFQCLMLKPIYVRNDVNTSSTETVYKAYDSLSNIFKSVNGLRFVGISVLLATVNEGYLYQFSNNGNLHTFRLALFFHVLIEGFQIFIDFFLLFRTQKSGP